MPLSLEVLVCHLPHLGDYGARCDPHMMGDPLSSGYVSGGGPGMGNTSGLLSEVLMVGPDHLPLLPTGAFGGAHGGITWTPTASRAFTVRSADLI
jgi:hypothetical protein